MGPYTVAWSLLAAADVGAEDIELLLGSPPARSAAAEKNWQKAQVFATGNAPSTCQTHRDGTDSLLVCLQGQKHVAITEARYGGIIRFPEPHKDFAKNRPLEAVGRRVEDGWRLAVIKEGQGLFIPKGCWHQVRSNPGSLGLSIVLHLGSKAKSGQTTSGC